MAWSWWAVEVLRPKSSPRRPETYPGAVSALPPAPPAGRAPAPPGAAPVGSPAPRDRRLSYRWAARPGWLLSHLFVLACVVLFVRLGFWQLSRLDERRTHNALVEARQSGPPVPVDEVVRPGAGPADVEAAVYRHVSVTGAWRADEQVLIRNETYQGAPGMWVVTPARHGRRPRRGREPRVDARAAAAGDPAAYAPPGGTVTVTGVVSATEEHTGLGPTDPAEGRLHDLARVDVGRLARQVDEPLYPVYVTLRTPSPLAGPSGRRTGRAGRSLPAPVPPPCSTTAPTSTTPGSGSSSPPSPAWCTRCCCGVRPATGRPATPAGPMPVASGS